ncbi:MAG TPA: hypothetical protein VHT97_03555 [Acidimicrobiales bacterium]|nr:hypothetical protein [Acidimicrobiales bacterium]
MPRNFRQRPVATIDTVFAFLLALVVAASAASHLVPGLSPTAAAAGPPGPVLGPRASDQTVPPDLPDRPAPVASASAVATAALPVSPAPSVAVAPVGPAMTGGAPLPAVATTAPAGPAVPAVGPPVSAVLNLPAGSGPVTAPSAPAAVLAPQPVAAKWLPSGKGMWIYEPAKTEGGNAAAIVARAKATGLTHLWVRMGSAWDGFNAAAFLDRLLPAAHAAGIKVIGWDFPKLDPVETDIQRATAMIRYRTPTGDRVDAFSPDIESPAEGTHLTPDAARRYGTALRDVAGADYPLIVTVPRPAKERPTYPYADIVAGYDAIAPMVYWLDRQPDTDVIGALATLSQFHKPLYPVGQAYDGSPEGGRKGVPPPEELFRFMRAAESHGAAGVSFWSWQAANQPAWNAIHDAVEFRLPVPTTVAAGAFPAAGVLADLPSRDPAFSP